MRRRVEEYQPLNGVVDRREWGRDEHPRDGGSQNIAAYSGYSGVTVAYWAGNIRPRRMGWLKSSQISGKLIGFSEW